MSDTPETNGQTLKEKALLSMKVCDPACGSGHFLLAAARAEGVSRLRGASELRAKESDRLQVMAAILRGIGIEVTEYAEGMDVVGDPEGWSGGTVTPHADHRMAMVGAVAGAASREGVLVEDVSCISVSYPAFTEAFTSLGGSWSTQDR